MSVLIAVAGRMLEPRQGVPHSDHAVAAPARYILALHRAGGHEAVLHPVQVDQSEARKRLSRFDGLLLLGGGDIDPSLYGEEALPEVAGIHADRDVFELSLVGAALDLGMPILAVCRGMQVLNVALGGSLHQHIPGHGTTSDWVTHDVEIEAGSLLADVVGSTRIECRSTHHQALKQIGDGLKETGWSEDRTIEAVEMSEGWVLGVQWHPELTAADDPAQQRLFDALVEKAAVRVE